MVMSYNDLGGEWLYTTRVCSQTCSQTVAVK